ncbi:NAD/FAD-dependent oxidoreductase [Salinarchaeum sp. Harcht-Bsk1]|uniref:NAD(P)/FAD-dependent oxidoreductase n=1 Tax=Salinarchaeum sp. Harcht-Bsk1 TaxID=1333523 RepID=UPI0003423D76|nr:FAD-dependent oxidoreductase [Salinarchaeum sp. Harcht-Bsk1]AGN01878.1 NAD/FAD-dependent oxidoreductase [Salinarchaeum sp. Harcht-Bsk1]
MTRHVAIVGAGVAGCATAYGLEDADAEVTVFERRTEAGGRAATRQREGCSYDVGANYLTAADDRVQQLVEGPLADDLVAVDGEVWTLDADESIAPGRDDGAPKWTGSRGVADIGPALLDPTDSDVRFDVDVAGIGCDDGTWTVFSNSLDGGDGTGAGDDARAGPFDDVVLTPPAPVTAELLRDVSVADSLRAAARSIEYRSITTVAARYEESFEWPYYALVDTSKTLDLGWIAREEAKPGHVSGDGSLVIFQASPQWSQRHQHAEDPALADAATDAAAALLDVSALADPVWTDVVRWKHALTDDGIATSVRTDPADAGLHVAGDWVAGESRLNAAIVSGLETADRLAERT